MTGKQKAAAVRLVLNTYLLASMVADVILDAGLAIRFYSLIALVIVNVLAPFVKKVFRTELSTGVYAFILVFAVVGTYTGNRFDLYHRFFAYDIALHLLSGIMIVLAADELLFPAAVRNASTALWRIFILAMIGIAGAAIWEICEFSLDIITGEDVQRNLIEEKEIFGRSWQNSGIKDTMNDMINGTAGALAGAILVFIRNIMSKSHRKKD